MPESLDPNDVRFFSGTSNRPLAEAIAAYLGVPCTESKTGKFSNDNLHIQLCASVRARHVFVVQSLTPPVSDRLLELLMMLRAAREAAAREVHAIIPYFSFARSDKKDAPRICITARLVADLLQTAGATHVMTMTLHSPQVHGFFSVPTDPLTSRPVLRRHFQQRDLGNTILVAPDMGHAKAATRFARDLGLPVAAGNKERISDTSVRITGIVGQPVGRYRRALIYDDEIATGGSMLELASVLIREGVQEIWAACTHAAFVGDALARMAAVPEITEIVTTDTVYIPPEARHPKLHMLPSSSIFGEAIRRNDRRESIGDLTTFCDND